MPLPLTEDDYKQAAQKLGCEVAAIKAVSEVESGPHGAFLPSGDPVILFERHWFSKFNQLDSFVRYYREKRFGKAS